MITLPVMMLKTERPPLDIPVYVTGKNHNKVICYLRFDIKQNKMYWESKTKEVIPYTEILQWQQISYSMVKDLYENR